MLVGRRFRFAMFTSENVIGSKSEAQKSNRVGNSLAESLSAKQVLVIKWK